MSSSRIAIDHEHRGVLTLFDGSNSPIGVQRFRRIQGGGAQCVLRRDSGHNPQFQLVLHGRAMEYQILSRSGRDVQVRSRVKGLRELFLRGV